ncbi:MAG: low molecular weight protein arginine phosphatase [Clostridia bacterium]|nr:low molecular weight protein arginine phosphatase [Clostridia bacterium]
MKTILFVCTGNTCRSPMAACLMNRLLQERGMTDWQAFSAGAAAFDGQPASQQALRAMNRRGLNLAAHRSRTVTAEMLKEVDYLICISPWHLDMLKNTFGSLPPSIVIRPGIPDPYGGTDSEYEACAGMLEEILPSFLPALKAAHKG